MNSSLVPASVTTPHSDHRCLRHPRIQAITSDTSGNRRGLEHGSNFTNYMLLSTEVGTVTQCQRLWRPSHSWDVKYTGLAQGLTCKMWIVVGGRRKLNWLGGQNGSLKQGFFFNNLWFQDVGEILFLKFRARRIEKGPLESREITDWLGHFSAKYSCSSL